MGAGGAKHAGANFKVGAGSLDPIALHTENVARLARDDIVVAGYPGAGATLLGNILLELELEYVDPYTQRIGEDGRATAEAERVAYRHRLAASSARDAESTVIRRPGSRFVKTHLYPALFGSSRPARCALLVRDPRDTLFSYYNWRLGFSEEGESRVFEEFLDEPNLFGIRPVDDWRAFHSEWLAQQPCIIRFEDIKKDPVKESARFLSEFGIVRSDAELIRALERSSFEAMRRHEDTVAGKSSRRIMRRGLTDEWVGWYHGNLAELFRYPAIRSTAREFGYELT